MRLSRWPATLLPLVPLLLLPLGCSEGEPIAPADASTAVQEEAAKNRSAAATFSSTVPLPNGFQPEGVAVGRGSTFFAGSLAGPFMGAVYRGDLRSGEGEILVPPAPGVRQAVGLAYDRRSDLLYVAGGGLGVLDVYDAGNGAPVASLSHPDLALANDLVITRDAVYVTDSFRSVLYRIGLGPAGRLSPDVLVEEIPLGGDYVFDPNVPFSINNNGIVATPDGRYIIVVNYGTGVLYRVDPASGFATVIEVDELLTEADGLVLEGRTLYAIQNFQNRVAVVELAPDFASGRVVRVITDERLRIPTTGAIFGSSLYVVNARFDVVSPFEPPPPDIFEIEFDLVKLRK